MKPKWKKKLVTLAILVPSVILIVEFEKWMKNRVEPCEDGTCPLPSGHGLFIDPFPDEIVPEGIATNQPKQGIEHE